MVHSNHENPNVPEHAAYEMIDAAELARRWRVKTSWIYDHIRGRCADPIPFVPLGKFPRFAWGSPKLEQWWQRQAARGAQPRTRKVSKQRNGGEFKRKENE